MNSFESKSTIQCALCGHTFIPAEKHSCAGCPLRKSCGLICCPNCGFQMPKESNLVEWVKQRLHKQKE